MTFRPFSPAEAGEIFEVELFDLSAARRLYQALTRQRPTMTEGERVAVWADFSLTIEAVAEAKACALRTTYARAG